MKRVKKIGPTIFLFVLITIAVFILGVQYGSYVALTNLKNSDKKIPTPKTETNKQGFHSNNLINEFNDCNFSFFYPLDYKVTKTASNSGDILSSKQNNKIYILCNTEPNSELISKLDSSSSANIKNYRGTIYEFNNSTRNLLVVQKTATSDATLLNFENDLKKIILRTFLFN